MGRGESRGSQLPCSLAVRAGGRLPCLHPSPPQKSNPGPHCRKGQGMPSTLWNPSWSITETSLGTVWPLRGLGLPGESLSAVLFPLPVPSMVAAAVPACFALRACNELLLAPGWLFANVNLLQTLLLITQSHWISLGAVACRGKV